MKTKLLLMLVVAAALVSVSAGAEEVAIVNPGFEDPVLNDGNYTSRPTGWEEGWYEPDGWPSWPAYVWGAGATNPDAGYGYDGIAPEGENVAYVTPDLTYDGGLHQILADTLQADMIYELSVLVGNPGGYNGGLPTCDYRIELLAGGVVVASTNDKGLFEGDPSPAPDTWTTASLTFIADPDHPQVGEPLEIRLIAVDFDAAYELNFDDVKLDAISDPMEPSPDNGEYVYAGEVELSWTNLDPNTPGDDVYVDVWFGTDPNSSKPANWGDFVTAGKNTTTVTVPAPVIEPAPTTYYWQVNSYINGSPTGEPIEGRIYKFYATTDIPPSAEIVGADMITWSGEAVQLDATVVDDELSGPLSYSWSTYPADGVAGVSVVFNPDEFVEDPDVTISKVPGVTLMTIVNPGFEDPALADGDWTYTPTGWKEGWYETDGSPSWPAYEWGAGVQNPDADYGYGGIAPEGENVAFVTPDAGYDGGLHQILADTLQADMIYELSVLVGNPGGYNGGLPTCDYRIELAAGGVVVASTNDNGLFEGDPSPAPDTWTTAGLTFVAEPNHPQLGGALEIRLIAVDDDAIYELNFDDVKLVASGEGAPPLTVELTLEVDDNFNPSVEDSMTIDVYDDACKAAIGAGAVNPSDFDADCITGLEDLAEMLLTWTDDNALTAPMVKEGSRLAAVANTGPELVAYWPFDEGTGDVAYDFMELNDAAMTDHTWVLPGKLGAAAISVTGDTEVNAGAGPTPTTEDLTLAWWMIDNHGSYGTIMSKSTDSSASGYNILVRDDSGDEDSPLRFRIGGWQAYGGWGEECRLPEGAYNDGVWVHITCTYDSATDTATIYLNGELAPNGAYNPKVGGIAGDDSYCDGVNNATEPLYIVGSPETFTGLIDEVAIWDTALTPDQVRSVYESGVGSLISGAKDPSPADGGYVHPASELELSWTNMDPNNPGDSVWVDVWFGTEPNELNPDHEMDKVVDAGENTTSVTVNASTLGETYYWQVNSYIYGDPATTSYDTNPGDPNMVEGRLWRFHTVTDVPVSVDAGSDVLAWSGQEVQLDGTVEDYGEDDVEAITWSANPDDGVVFSDPSVEDPTVTITKATDNPSIVTLTLSAQDGIGSDEDTMEIVVYDTACLAAIGEGEEFDPGDFDADCITSLADFAVIAEDWLVDYTLTEPAKKP